MVEEERGVAHLRQSIEGQLLKFTNVMKGYQPRWLVLDAERNVIEYYEKEENRRSGHKARGTLHLFGAAIYPSDEDSQTFTIQSAGPGNELFRLKAADAKERQRWITHLRVVSECSQPHSFLALSNETADTNVLMPRSVSDSADQHGFTQPIGWQVQHNLTSPIAQATGLHQLATASNSQSAAMQASAPHEHGGESTSDGAEPIIITDISSGAVRKHLVELIERMNQECELTSAHICALPTPNVASSAASIAPSFVTAGTIADASSLTTMPVNDSTAQQPIDSSMRSLDCLDHDLLMMKATIRAAIASVKECLQLLDARKTILKPDAASSNYLHAFRNRPRVASMKPANSGGLQQSGSRSTASSSGRDLQAARLGVSPKTRSISVHNADLNSIHSGGRAVLSTGELNKSADTINLGTGTARLSANFPNHTATSGKTSTQNDESAAPTASPGASAKRGRTQRTESLKAEPSGQLKANNPNRIALTPE